MDQRIAAHGIQDERDQQQHVVGGDQRQRLHHRRTGQCWQRDMGV
jgi:hypothetical protein